MGRARRRHRPADGNALTKRCRWHGTPFGRLPTAGLEKPRTYLGRTTGIAKSGHVPPHPSRTGFRKQGPAFQQSRICRKAGPAFFLALPRISEPPRPAAQAASVIWRKAASSSSDARVIAFAATSGRKDTKPRTRSHSSEASTATSALRSAPSAMVRLPGARAMLTMPCNSFRRSGSRSTCAWPDPA